MIFKNGKHIIDIRVGPRLKIWMLEKGITQGKMAADTGITQHAISKIINEKVYPSSQTLITLCQVYKLDYIWLTTGVVVKNSK